MGTSGRSAWGAGSVTGVPGGRWCQSVGIKGRLTHTVGSQRCYLLRNKGALGQVQARQIDWDAEPPNVRVCPAQGLEGWINWELLQETQWGSQLSREMLQVLLPRGCSWDTAQANLHGPRRALELPLPMDTQAEHRDVHQDTGSPPSSALLVFPFLDLCNGWRAEAACRELEQGEMQAACIPWGSLECPKRNNWPPHLSCLPQRNYSSMTNMTN